MAIIKKDGNYMGLPMNIARGNPIPLDKSEIWYSYDEMINYAQTSAVAYVGQILGLVNEENNIATAYIILNVNGDVQEVGKATMVDNTTIVLNEETLSLKDFGKRFYKYIPEEEGKAASYQLVDVDENNPWKAGLEPKVVSEDGKFVLGWYEPNPTTMEGVNAQIAGIQTTVIDLTNTTNNLTQKLNNTYTKEETNAQIAAAAHLKRVKVDSVEDIDPTAAGADQYIYMVPSGLEAEDNKYYEYMVIEIDGLKQIERVGSWEVDLSKYATEDYVDTNFVKQEANKGLVDLTEIAKLSTVEENAEQNIIDSVSENFNISTDGNRRLELVSIPSELDLTSNISLSNFFVHKDNNKDLVSKTEIQKLATISENAEQNIINSVSEEFIVSNDGERKLQLVSIDGSKIANLSNNSDFNTVKIDLVSAQNDIESISSSLNSINASLVTMNNKFNNYVLITDHENDMANVWERLTWHEL